MRASARRRKPWRPSGGPVPADDRPLPRHRRMPRGGRDVVDQLPELSGTVSCADTPEEITAKAHDALTPVIEGMIEDGQAVPSTIEEVGAARIGLDQVRDPASAAGAKPGRDGGPECPTQS